MIIWLISVLIALNVPSESSRGLPAQPEPDVESSVIYQVYAPHILVGKDLTVAGTVRPIWGYATPHQRVYNGAPFYNWGQYPRHCTNPDYWPMARGQMSYDISICDNGDRMLLLYNEPELGSFSATPKQAVDFVEYWVNDWTGPVACCGNFYSDGGGELTGLQWFMELIEEYHIKHGIVPPIDYIHIHVYEHRRLNINELRTWRQLADANGWGMIVSESGTFPSEAYPPQEVAERLPDFLSTVERELRPDYLFWFSDYIQPWALGGPPQAAWHHFNLTHIDGSITPVGRAWQDYTGTVIQNQPRVVTR